MGSARPDQPSRRGVLRWGLAAAIGGAAAAGLAAWAWGAHQRPDREAEVRSTVRAWLGAVADQDGRGACRLMDGAARQQLADLQPGSDCPATVRQLSEALGPDARSQLRGVGVAQVTFPQPGRAVARLGAGGQWLGLRGDGRRWLISDVGTAVRTGGGGAFPPMPTTFFPSPPS